MSLKQKLYLSIGIITIMIIISNGLMLKLLGDINRYENELLYHTAPALIALGQIKALGLELSESALAILETEEVSEAAQQLFETERLEFEARRLALGDWLLRLEAIYIIDPHQTEHFQQIQDLSTTLETLALNQLQYMETGGDLNTFLQERERLEEVEMEFQEVIDHSIEFEQTQYESATALMEASRQSMEILSLVLLVVLPAVSMGFGLWLVSLILRSITVLSEAAVQISKGNLETRVQFSTHDEFGLLAQAFNDMAAQLSSNMVSREYFETIFHSVPNSLVVVGPNQKIEMVNTQTAKMLGYGSSVEALVGKSYRSILKIAASSIADFVEEARALSETTYRRKDDSEIPVSVNYALIRNQAGEAQKIVYSATDISERKRLQAELIEKQRLAVELTTARRIEDFKRRFIAMISHEVRTPLTIINTSTYILTKHIDRLESNKRGEHLQRIEHQVERLKQLLDDMAMVMQAENDEMPFSPTMINLESMCREIASELQATIGVHHQFVMQIDPLPELIYADPILISRIITNLITNAVKYSPKRSEVQISLSVEQRHILMRIRDQGIGIPPEDQKYLFQSYFRASNVEEINGTGLGLRIVKEAIELHGGRIEVESQLKQGTTFTVFLPIVINSSSTSSEKKRTEQRVEKPLPIKPDPR